MSELVTVQCPDCGCDLEREEATGPLAEKINALPMRCQRCAEQLEEEDRAAAARAADERRTGFATSLPRNLRRLGLDGLEVTAGNELAIAAARRWGAREIHGLLLCGPFGVGKTYIAAAAVWERLLTAEHPISWNSVPALLQRALSRGQERGEAIAALTGTNDLVLDDLDKFNPGDWAASQLLAAIDARIQAGAGLIVTSNLKLNELRARLGGQFGAAIASRLAGYCTACWIEGKDRRLMSHQR